MKNKRTILYIAIPLIIIILISFLINYSSKKTVLETYEKYSISMTISSISKDSKDSILLKYSNDGKYSKITSNKINKAAYIINDKLYFYKNDVLNECYIYKLNKSYKDIQGFIVNLKNYDKIKEENGYSYYSKVLNPREINDLLDILMVSNNSSSNSLINFSTKNDKISDFSLTISSLEGYESASIKMKFKEEDENFMIDATKVLSGKDASKYKFIETQENIFDFFKKN